MYTRALAWLALTALLLATASTTTAIPTVTANGAKLFDSDGNQFFIKGVAYQLTSSDPLTTPTQCALDAALMKTLGANTIRVYHANASANHDECMKVFEEAGIYLLVDLETFDTSITPDAPAWTLPQYTAYTLVMDAFASYPNTIGFFIGNEVISSTSQSLSAPYIKAAAADLKLYRDSKGYRKLMVGYAAADISGLRPQLQDYLACVDSDSSSSSSSSSDEAVDFYSLNSYEWCGQSTFLQSGYSTLQNLSLGYNLPIFFSETGCNASPPRTFDDQDAILGEEMDGVWAGAVVYEWIQETNSYGLISYGPPAPTLAPDAAAPTDSAVQGGYTRTGTPTPILPDFTNLQSHWATLTPTGTPSSLYTPSLSPPACPTVGGGWEVGRGSGIPTLGLGLTRVTSATGVSGTSGGTGTGGAGATGSGASGKDTSTNGAGKGMGALVGVGMMSLSVGIGMLTVFYGL